MKWNDHLSEKQEWRWRILATVTVAGIAFGVVRMFRYDFSDPGTTGIFVAAMLAIAYAERIWVRKNTDADGRIIRR